MTDYCWVGPITTHLDRTLAHGTRVTLDPLDPLVRSWLALGYLQPLPPSSTSKKEKS